MQLGNTRVWDYVGDNFVHRLLQNNEDGWVSIAILAFNEIFFIYWIECI
jgi:hypothetical protein